MDELFNRYFKNKEFLQKNYKDIFDKINILDDAISKGLFQEKLFLEYKENYFDISFGENRYFYNQNSLEYSKKILNNLDFSKNKAIYTIRDISIPKIDIDDNLEENGYKYIYHLYSYRKNCSEYIIKKFIFVGIGLGIHIKDIIKKYNLDSIFIVEPNIEIFRLSLFVVDYYKFNCKLFFSVADSIDEMVFRFDSFYNYNSKFNYLIKFHLFDLNYKYILEHIYYKIDISDFFRYSISESFIYIKRLIKREKEKYNFILLNYDMFKNKSAILIAPGPSLEKNIDFIKKYKDKAIVVAVAASLKVLDKYNIIPDIIISLEHREIIINQFKVSKSYFNSILVASASTPDSVLKLFKKENIFLFPKGNQYGIEEAVSFIGSTVGEIAYQFLLFGGISNLYLVGLDAAYGIDGSSHSKEHNFYKKDDKEKKIKVKGNKREIVYTNSLWLNTIRAISLINNRYKKDYMKFYNLSDGAKFENIEKYNNSFIPSDKSNIKGILYKNIKNYFNINLKKEKEILSILIDKVDNYLNIQVTNLDELLTYIEDYYNFIQLNYNNLSRSYSYDILLKYINFSNMLFYDIVNCKTCSIDTNKLIFAYFYPLKYILQGLKKI